MIKFLIHLLFLSLLCVGLSRCKHIPEPDCGDAQTVEEMKQWVLFKPGTYWIYEEETSGALDTVIVTEYFDGLSSGGFAAFGCVMHSSFDGYNYDYYFNDSYSYDCQGNGNCRCRRVACSKSKPGDFFGDDYVFIFPNRIGNKTGQNGGGWSSGYTTIVAIDEQFLLNDMEYTSVVTYNLDIGVQHNWHSAKYSLAKGVGIIKKEIDGISEIWTLLEYQIVQ